MTKEYVNNDFSGALFGGRSMLAANTNILRGDSCVHDGVGDFVEIGNGFDSCSAAYNHLLLL